jgi:hypothetical protein
MTSIYKVNDIEQTYFYVPDSTTQANGQALNQSTWTFVVGTQDQANVHLSNVQIAFLQLPETNAHFSCMKSIGQDADGNNIWTSCNIYAETANTSTIYELYCDTYSNQHQRAIGTEQALSVRSTHQQSVLQWANKSQVFTMNTIPVITGVGGNSSS